MQTRRLVLTSVAALAALGLIQGAQAQSWPRRPVRDHRALRAGGSTDGIARIIAQRLSETFGQQVIVENRPGEWRPRDRSSRTFAR
jgi:tripartite-type tricarboxylate transporter receptor subunit TctC